MPPLAYTSNTTGYFMICQEINTHIMITIEIWGDSWASPKIFFPQGEKEPGPREISAKEAENRPPYWDHKWWFGKDYNSEVLIDPLLKNLGYNVVNHADPGMCVSYSPVQSMMESTQSDYVVMFHTCLCRELISGWVHKEEWLFPKPPIFNKHTWLNISNLDDAMDQIADITYATIAKAIVNKKFIVVEGQNLLHPNYKKHFEPFHIIKDIKSSWTNQQLPETQWLTLGTRSKANYDPPILRNFWTKYCKDTTKRKKAELDKCFIIVGALSQSKYFPDSCHPGSTIHKSITHEIHQVIQKDLVKSRNRILFKGRNQKGL